MKVVKAIKPSRMWIDGKCFNIRQFKKITGSKETDLSEITEEVIDHGFNIATDENGKFSTSFRLPDVYYKKIVGHRDFKVDMLEIATSTKISVPANGTKGSLTITGEDTIKIVEARHQVHSVIDHIRNSYPPVQFTSIPVLSDEIKENFMKFKNEILNSDQKIEGMCESIFQSPLKLHLTVSVFSLFDKNEINEAKQTLNNCNQILKNLIAGAGPLRISVAGLDCMNNNHAKVNVLYANARIVNENENLNLQRIANSIAEYFYERGFVRKPEESVKLHCTLINTKYRKTSEGGRPKKNRYTRRWPSKRQPFDARFIMEKYKDYHFGVCNFDSVHLSLMSSVDKNGFYKPISILRID